MLKLFQVEWANCGEREDMAGSIHTIATANIHVESQNSMKTVNLYSVSYLFSEKLILYTNDKAIKTN